MTSNRQQTLFVLFVGIALHLGLGYFLVNSALHLEPDQAEFLIGARSLATGHGYQDLSDPIQKSLGRPLGMSMLLAPIVGACGYDVVLCKWLILSLGALACCLGYFAADRIAGRKTAITVLFLLAVTPLTLIHDARMMSEAPHALLSLAVLLCVLPPKSNRAADASIQDHSGPPAPISWPRLLLLGLLILVAEKVRSHAIALWPALALWGLFRSDRRRILFCVGAGFLTSRAIDLIPSFGTSAVNIYLTYMRSILESQGIKGILKSFASSAWLYVSCPVAAWIPPLWPGLGDDGIVPGEWMPNWLRVVLGSVVIVLTVRAIRKRFREHRFQGEAVFVAAYFLGSFCILLIWPHRMSRLFFPLMPIVMIYFWSQVQAVPVGNFRRIVALLGFAAYLFGAGSLIHQQRLYRGVARADWTLAQDFLREQTPPSTRIITNVKGLFLRTFRYQFYVPETTLSLNELNGYIFERGTKYIIVADWEHEPQIQKNPAVLFRPLPIETGRDHLWEIEPNRTGIVEREMPGFLRIQLDEAIAAAKSEEPPSQRPNEHTHILRVHGRPDLAELLLRKYLTAQPDDPMQLTDVNVEMGNALLEQGKGGEALTYYERAKGGYNSDLYYSAIVACEGVAKDYMLAQDDRTPVAQRASILENIAKAYVDVARWKAAQIAARKAVQLDPRRASPHLILSRIAQISGDAKLAKQELEIALANLANYPNFQSGNLTALQEDATTALVALEGPSRIRQAAASDIVAGQLSITVDPTDPATFVQLCEALVHQRFNGIALDVAERGAIRHPKSSDILVTLAQLRMQFGQFDQALADAQKAQSLAPNPETDKVIAKIEAVLQSPPVR